MHQPIAVLGAGSWGTALALNLSRHQQPVRLWTQEAERVALMQADRANNRYLPGQIFPPTLSLTHDLATAIADDVDILVAVPSVGFRHVLQLLKPLISPNQRIVWATKGLDSTNGEMLHHIAHDILGTHRPLAILSGPSFAVEVALGLPTAVVLASHDAHFAADLQQRFNSPTFRTYLSTDVVGVEIGGIVKNTLAIAAGISDGLQLGANARVALITRGLAEMTRLGLAVGGRPETFMGLAGMGDLILTATDNQSRNRRFGLALGGGNTIAEAEKNIGQVIEGKRNTELLIQLAQKLGVEMPICHLVWEIIEGQLSPKQAVEKLMARSAPKSEQLQ